MSFLYKESGFLVLFEFRMYLFWSTWILIMTDLVVTNEYALLLVKYSI